MTNKKKNLMKNRKVYNGLLIIVFIAILFFITIHKLEGNKLNLKFGDVATEDIRAIMELEDNVATEEAKENAANKVEPKYRIQPSVQMTMKTKIKDLLDATRDAKSQDISVGKQKKIIEESQELDLTENEISMILGMEYKSLNQFENNLMDLINQLMGTGIKESELEYEKENLEGTFKSLNMKDDEKEIGLRLIGFVIEPNEFIDEEATTKRKEEAIKNIETIVLQENEIIAEKGSTIKERELDLMKESGLLKNDDKISIGTIIGLFILIIMGISIVGLYIYYFNNEILYNNKLLILLIIVTTTIIISRSLYLVSPYIMPVATTALLVSVLISSKLGLLINLFLIFFLGFILKLDTNVIAMYIIGGSLGVIVNVRQKQRHNIFVNGVIVGVANIITLICFGLAKGTGFVNSLDGSIHGFLGGIISAVLALGTMPIWENVFHILTPLKLLELSDPNQPLLKKLMLEAPGTHHHSILVGNLAEASAEAISANPLISRVGSYYHDIGKTLKPYYFSENQFGMENPHDKLEPIESARIIIDHTTDGIRMAKKHNLPKEIIDIIDQHHGTTTVAYFYHKAKKENLNMDISMDDFRYKGKKPQTKEAAIVMMCDSSEAAVRSIKDLTRESIEDMVRKVVKGKVDAGQMEECNITLLQIELVIKSIINVLTGIYHDRIEYPDDKKAIEVKV